MAVVRASSTGGALRLVPPLTMALLVVAVSIAGLAVPLATAQSLRLTPPQVTAWIVALYGISGLLSFGLTFAYRQPLCVGFSVASLVFFASLAGNVGYSDLQGATLVAGGVLVVLGALGLTARAARLVPAPIVFGVLAGSVLPFVVGIFDALADERLLVGGALLAYVLGRRLLGARIPAILPALVAGLALAAASGRFGRLPAGWTAAELDATRPTFSLAAVATVVPVVVALIALGGNLPAVVYLRSQGYRPPARLVDVATGFAAMGGAFLGPTALNLAALLSPLTAGPEAGEHRFRHWSVYGAGIGWMLVALAAGAAAALPSALPVPLLLAVAGLALVGVLAEALNEVTRGPLRLGPLFAFAIASSRFTLLGLGPLFWALVLGTGISLLLETGGLRELRAAGQART